MSGGNAGRLFAEFDASDSGVKGTIGLHDEARGVIVFACVGQVTADAVEFVCTPPSPPISGEPGEMRLRGSLDADGQVMGTWTSSSGAEGAFVLFPEPR